MNQYLGQTLENKKRNKQTLPVQQKINPTKSTDIQNETTYKTSNQSKLITKKFQQQQQSSYATNDEYTIKLNKIHKQIDSLNTDIEYILKQIQCKSDLQKVLTKQKAHLQNTFLYKSYQKSKQIGRVEEILSDEVINPKLNKNNKAKTRNIFRNVNEKIVQYTEFIQKQIKRIIAKGQQTDNNGKDQKVRQQDYIQTKNQQQKLPCQSLHLLQIFNPQQQNQHKQKKSQLEQKLALLHEKIKLHLQKQQPYVHQKIFQRIKRQGQKQTKIKMLGAIQKMIKENAVWMTQESNKVNNKLQEKEIQQKIVSNLQKMKNIMSKKIENNDYIYENYANEGGENQLDLGIEDNTKSKKLTNPNSNVSQNNIQKSVFPIGLVKQKYLQITKKLNQNRISQQLNKMKYQSVQCQVNKKNQLKKELQNKLILNLLNRNSQFDQQFIQQQKYLLQKCQDHNKRIEQMLKN